MHKPRNEIINYETIIVNLIRNNSTISLEECFQLVVQHEHQCSASTAQDVGERPLEEGSWPFGLAYLDPAVQRVLVHDVGLSPTRLHHHAPPDSVEWI
jgi:hypothetical protein